MFSILSPPMFSLSSLLVSLVFTNLPELAFIIKVVGCIPYIPLPFLPWIQNQYGERRAERGRNETDNQNTTLALFQVKLIGESDLRSVAIWVCRYFIPELDGLSPQWHSQTTAGLPNKAACSPPGHADQTVPSLGAGGPEGESIAGAEPRALRSSS